MPIRGANPHPKGQIGQVIASYGSGNVDLDSDGEQFVIDPERVEMVNRDLQLSQSKTNFGQIALYALGGIALTAAALYAVKAFGLFDSDESTSA